jgi:hypothetical protein
MYSFDPALDTPAYSINDVAAAGISTAKVKKLLDEGVISLGPYDQEATEGVPELFTLRRVISIAVAAKARGLKMDKLVAGVIARSFTDGDARNRPWLKSPRPPFIILFPEKNEFKFISSANRTLRDPLIPPSGGRAETFVGIDSEYMIQLVKDRLAKRKARKPRSHRRPHG